MAVSSYSTISTLASIHDSNRPVGHIPRVELVRGDACETIPKYLDENPHLVVSLLVLDFDVYAPTRVAIDRFSERMPRGASIAFDELNCKDWPGETTAFFNEGCHRWGKLKRFPYASTLSYMVLD